MQHTGTLGSVGHDARGRPIAAYVNSMASRTPSGAAIFIAVRLKPGFTKMRSKVFNLHREIARIAAAAGR